MTSARDTHTRYYSVLAKLISCIWPHDETRYITCVFSDLTATLLVRMAVEWSSSGGCCSCCWWFWDSICCGCCECVRAITTQSTKEKRYAHIAYKEVKPDIDSGAVSGDALENESGEQKQLLKDDHDDDDDEYVLIPSPSAAPDDGDKNDSELSALDSGGSNSLPDCFSASPDALTAVKKSPCATRQAPPMVQGVCVCVCECVCM